MNKQILTNKNKNFSFFDLIYEKHPYRGNTHTRKEKKKYFSLSNLQKHPYGGNAQTRRQPQKNNPNPKRVIILNKNRVKS